MTWNRRPSEAASGRFVWWDLVTSEEGELYGDLARGTSHEEGSFSVTKRVGAQGEQETEGVRAIYQTSHKEEPPVVSAPLHNTEA